MNDKIKHFIIGFILGMSILLIGYYSIILATVIFIGKEIYDCFKPNPTGFDVMDLLADYLGYGASLLMILLL